jgi:hypothetical protein
MNDNSPDNPRVEILIHLGIVCQNHALRAKAAPIADADQKTVAGINPYRIRQVHTLANVHAQGAQMRPAPLAGDFFKLRFGS